MSGNRQNVGADDFISRKAAIESITPMRLQNEQYKVMTPMDAWNRRTEK